MDDSVFRWTAVEGRYSLNGASYVLSIKLDWQSIRSAIIYDDELAVTFTDPLGHLQWLVMPLVRTYDDVGNIELRGQDDSSDTGWRYVPFEFARGVPDLTPVKVKGTTDNDVLYGGLGADVVKGGKGNDILHGERVSDNHCIGGDDVLVGGHGDDIMTGGKGRDVFHMQSLADGGQAYDQVTDFELGIDTVAHIPDEAVICNALKSGTDDIVSHVHIYQIVDDSSLYLELTIEDIALDDFTALVDEAGSLKNLLINGLPEPEKNTYPDGAIIGTEWDDPLLGELGDDMMYGGKGDDFLGGDLGNDVMTGGKGADIFYFSSRWADEPLSDDELPADNHDRVTDFEVGTDKIGIHTGDGSRLGIRLITRDVDETETVKGLKVTLDEANSIKVNFDTALSVEAWDSLVDGAGGLNELVFTEVWA